MKLRNELKRMLDHEIKALEAELNHLDGASEDYERCVKNLNTAIEARNKLDKIDWNKLIPVLINALLLIPMIWYSKHDILDSKMGTFLKNWLLKS